MKFGHVLPDDIDHAIIDGNYDTSKMQYIARSYLGIESGLSIETCSFVTTINSVPS